MLFLHCIHKLRSKGLRDSASPVLTATDLVNGKGQFLAPYRIDTPQPITKKLSQLITSATPTAVPNLVHIRPRGAPRRMVKYNQILFIYSFIIWAIALPQTVSRY